MLGNISQRRCKNRIRTSGEASSARLDANMCGELEAHAMLPCKLRDSAIFMDPNHRSADNNRANESAVLTFMAQDLGGKMAGLKASLIVQHPRRGLGTHTPLARHDPQLR